MKSAIFLWNIVCFLTRSIVSMSIKEVFRLFTGLISYKKYLIKGQFLLKVIKLWNFIFDKGLFQLSGERSCFFSKSIWQGTKKCMLSTALGLPKETSFCFGIGRPRFFLRVTVTIISKRFVKLGITVFYRI